MTKRICERCERHPCKCKCPQCKGPLPESSTRRYIYCSSKCRQAAHRKRLASKNVASLTQSLTNERNTPAIYIEAARRVLRGFDLDPASTEDAYAVIQAGRYFTEHDVSLSHPWNSRISLNPAYY